MTHDRITNGIRVALLATVTLWAAPGHAQSRPYDPLPIKLPDGFKVVNGPGDIIRVDTYPGFSGTIKLPSAFKDVVVGDEGVVEVLPLHSGNDTILIRAIPNTPLPVVYPTLPYRTPSLPVVHPKMTPTSVFHLAHPWRLARMAAVILRSPERPTSWCSTNSASK